MHPHALVLFALALVPATAAAAPKLNASDQAWIESCVAQRKGNSQAALRGYCTCMHEVVDDNRRFEITELERSYPPVHQRCWKTHRLKPG